MGVIERRVRRELYRAVVGFEKYILGSTGGINLGCVNNIARIL